MASILRVMSRHADGNVVFSPEFSLILERENSIFAPLRGGKGGLGRRIWGHSGVKVPLSTRNCTTFSDRKSYSRRPKVPQLPCKSGTFARALYASLTTKARKSLEICKIKKACQNRVFWTKVKMFFTEALVEADFLVKFS